MDSEKKQLILITGFLGAGKTSLLQNILSMYKDKRMHIIVNEFGKVGVDGTLLKKLSATIDEINNGSVFCSCRQDQFEDSLEFAAKQDIDLIIVEASGLSDPTAIRSILETNSKFGNIVYKGCIGIADAKSFTKVIDTARVCHKQLSMSDLILLTKTDIVSEEKTNEVKEIIKKKYPGIDVVNCIHGIVDKSKIDGLSIKHGLKDADNKKDLTLQKRCIVISEKIQLEQLKSFIHLFVEDTYRVKGFVKLSNEFYNVDCVGSYVKVEKYTGTEPNEYNKIVALAGKNMNLRKSLNQAISWYEGLVWEE